MLHRQTIHVLSFLLCTFTTKFSATSRWSRPTDDLWRCQAWDLKPSIPSVPRRRFAAWFQARRAEPLISQRDILLEQQETKKEISEWNGETSFASPDDEDDDDWQVMMIHDYFMGMALAEAEKAAQRGEVPVGAVVVRNFTTTTARSADQPQQPSSSSSSSSSSSISETTASVVYYQVLSRGSNRVEETVDASAHAELVALRQAAQCVGNWRLPSTTLYSTLEPCPMCLSAALAFRIDRLVYGAPDLRLGAVTTHLQLLDGPRRHPFHEISHVVPHVRRDECAQLMRDFFRQRRQQQPLAMLPRQPRENSVQHQRPLRRRSRQWYRRIRSWMRRDNSSSSIDKT